MFIDEVIIRVAASKGGNEAVSFRREKYVPKNGPDDGNDGHGDHIYLKTDQELSTLSHLRYKKSYSAMPGVRSAGGNKSGKNGEDLVIKVPAGTVVRRADNQRL